ncbi:MAG: hypothetical protein WCK86_10445, partial [Planctomycetia bacterium]
MRQLAGSLCSLGLGISAFCGSAMAIDRTDSKAPDAVMVRTVGEQKHFALALRSAFAPVSVKRHLLLVDTSASQTGIYRMRTLATLQELLRAIPAGHEVQLVAADSTVRSLTEGFVAAGSADLTAAIQKLKQTTPMGATDLASAIRETLPTTAGAAISVAYIGDGMSAGDMLSGADLDAVVNDLQARQASFHAMLLGPRVDAQLAGILANQTGGSLQLLSTDDVTSAAKTIAAEIQHAPVLVRDLKITTTGLTLAAPDVVALRADRHTLVFGAGSASGAITVTATVQGKAQTWTINPADVQQGGSE